MKTAPNYGSQIISDFILLDGSRRRVFEYRDGKQQSFLELCMVDDGPEAAKRHARAMGLVAYRMDAFGDLVPV
jgi:hypothetical protein